MAAQTSLGGLGATMQQGAVGPRHPECKPSGRLVASGALALQLPFPSWRGSSPSYHGVQSMAGSPALVPSIHTVKDQVAGCSHPTLLQSGGENSEPEGLWGPWDT